MYYLLQEDASTAGEAGPSNAGEQSGERRPKHREQTKSHVADMLAAMAAHQQLERYACHEHLKQQQHATWWSSRIAYTEAVSTVGMLVASQIDFYSLPSADGACMKRQHTYSGYSLFAENVRFGIL